MKVESLALVLAISLLLFGCITPNPPLPGATPTPQPSPLITPAPNETPGELAPFAAREGLAAAREGVTWLRPDAELVGVQGSCEGEGKSPSWQYSFDSRAAGIGYVVSVPGAAESMRDVTFSFSQPLGEQWADSTRAASACGAGAGDFSLEVRDGTPVWTIISGSTFCEVNATSGQRLAGD